MAKTVNATVRKLEREIQSVVKLVAREGKTDAIEEQLDELEQRIGDFGNSDQNKTFAKRLKDQLDKVK